MSKHYSEDLIEEVRISNDIVDVISEYVRLEKKSKYHFGLCPFHNEKTPSFTVTPSRQIFYCYGCGKTGNVISFIKYVENLDFLESVRFLADKAKIQLPEGDDEAEKEKLKIKEKLMSINTEAARFFHSQLNDKSGEKAMKYLHNREISSQTIRRFGIGYATESWDLLYNHLKEKYEDSILLKSGIIKQNKNGGYYDSFRSRIMFPIFDLRGNVIGFGGRVLDDSLPKYINSQESIIYSKSKSLYALNFAKNSGSSSLIIVEGYMDVVSLHQNGITNAVASLGTALTESQGRLLKKYSEEIIIAYDADTAGQAATLRGLDVLNDIGCNVKVLTVPEGKDPDEFIKKQGKEAFENLVNKSMSLVEYKIKILKSQWDTGKIDGKIGFLNKTADVLSKIDNEVESEIYIEKISKEYLITKDAITSEVLKRRKPKTEPRQKQNVVLSKEVNTSSNAQSNERLAYFERFILSIIAIDNKVYTNVKNILNPDLFSETRRDIAVQMFNKLEQKRDMFPADLLTIVNETEATEYSRIIHQECNFEDNSRAVLDIIRRMEIIKFDERQQQILQLLSNGSALLEGDVEKLKQELQEIILKRRKH